MVSKCKDDWKHGKYLFETILEMEQYETRKGLARVEETEAIYYNFQGAWLLVETINPCEACGNDWGVLDITGQMEQDPYICVKCDIDSEKQKGLS